MNCAECREAIIATLEGVLEASSCEALDGHLASCPACRAERDGISRLRERILRDAAAIRERSVTSTVMRRVLASPRPGRRRLVRAWVPTAAALVVALLGGLYWLLSPAGPLRPEGGGPVLPGAERPARSPGSGPDHASGALLAVGRSRTIRGRVVRVAEKEGAATPGPSAISPARQPPVEGAVVRVRRRADGPAADGAPLPVLATTARDGDFELAGVPEDVPLILEVDDGTSAILALEVPGRGDPVLDLSDLTLEPCAHLEVRLVGPDGAPVEGARVAAERSRRAPFSPLGPLESRMGRPIGGGAYRLEPLWPGPVRVHASAPDCLPKSIQVWVPRPDPLEVRLESGLAIAGRVVTAGGEPIAGAEVRVDNQLPDEGAVVRTGPDGTFSTGRALTDAPRRVTVTAEGYAEGLVRHDPGGRAELSIVLVPEPRGTVSGSVVDEAGRPVEGARVTLHTFGRRERTAATDAAGRFEVARVDDATYALQAIHRAFAGSNAPLVEVAGGAQVGDPVVLRMRRGLVLVGTVVDAVTDAPVPGSEVSVERLDHRGDPGERRTETTGADGTFRVRGLRKGTVSISAVAVGYLPSLPQPLELGPAAGEVRLVLEKAGSISGRVLTAAGVPVPGASVRPSIVIPCDDRSPAVERLRKLEATTDGDGRYVLDGLPPHPAYGVSVRHPDLTPGEREGLAVERGDRVDGIDVTLSGGAVIRGRLLARGGGALEVPWIVAADAGKALAARDAGSCRTHGPYPYSDGLVCEDGRFEIRHLVPGTYSLFLGSPSAIRDGVAVADGAVVEVGDLEIDPPRRRETEREPEPPAGSASAHWGTIAGRVSAEDPDALLDFEVTAVGRRTGGSSGHSDRDPAGRFEMLVAPGTYIVRATAPGHALSESDEITVEGGERVEGIAIDLTRGGSIAGVVIDCSTGLPVEGASVSVEGDPRDSSSATSDASGRFAISMAPGGAARLRVRDPAHVEKLVEGIAVRPGETSTLVVELEPGGTIAGTVLRGGRPVPDALVKVLRAATRESVGGARADAGGRFEVAGLPSGDHVVTLPGEPGFTETPIRVEAGHVARVELVAEGPGPIRLSARLTAGGAPAHGQGSVKDLVRGWSGEGFSLPDGADGRFTVDLPAPGTYSLDFEPFGRNARINGFRFEVPEGSESRLLEIELPSGEIAGIVVDEANGAPPGAGFVWAVEMSERSRCPWLLAPLSTCPIDGRGRFVIPCLAPGTYAVHAWAEGHAGGRVDAVRVGTGPTAPELRIALGPEARLKLRVADESGAPIGRFGAMVRDGSGAWLLPSSTRVRSEPGGLAVVGGLAPGVHTVTVFAKGFASAAVVAEAAASPAEASVVLSRPGTATIRVVDEHGASVLGAEVTVLDAAGDDAIWPCSFPAAGGPPGEAVLRDLAPGTYRATARKDGRVSREETFTVTAGEVTEVRLVLGSGG